MEDEEMHAYEDTFTNDIPDTYVDYLSNFETRCNNRRFYDTENKGKFSKRLLILLLVICVGIMLVYLSTRTQVS